MKRLLNMQVSTNVHMLILGIAIGIQLGFWAMIIGYNLP
jgi:hypothetical protein